MKIDIHNQQLKVGDIEVIAISASSNLQVGDNDQVLLYSAVETPPSGIKIGPFPSLYPNGKYEQSTHSNSSLQRKKRVINRNDGTA